MGGRGRGSDLSSLTAILGLAVLGCVLLYGFRVAVSGRIWYLYLVLNLALAGVPYLIAALGAAFVGRAEAGRGRALLAAPFAVLWFVFYPNAPYILTDFIHVINRTYLRTEPAYWLGLGDLVWYDLVMNAAFAFMGHFIGLVSMWFTQSFLKRAWGRAWARVLVLSAIALSGFGIYLGRFRHLNTWDLVVDPARAARQVFSALGDIKALLFSAAFALFIFLSYAALVMFQRASAAAAAEDGA